MYNEQFSQVKDQLYSLFIFIFWAPSILDPQIQQCCSYVPESTDKISYPAKISLSYLCCETERLKQLHKPVIFVLLFSKEMAYRVYDEFDETEIEYQQYGDLMVCAKMPVDTWLIGYLLSFGAQVEIIEPKYLKGVLAAQALAIYEKNKP